MLSYSNTENMLFLAFSVGSEYVTGVVDSGSYKTSSRPTYRAACDSKLPRQKPYSYQLGMEARSFCTGRSFVFKLHYHRKRNTVDKTSH